MSFYYFEIMTDIRLLKREDLTYIENEIKRKLKIGSVALEIGILAFDPEGDSKCVLLIRDERDKRYKIEAMTRWYKHNGEASMYPSSVWECGKHKQNFALDDVNVVKVFDSLAKGYESGIIDGKTYMEHAKLLTTNREEFIRGISLGYGTSTQCLIGLLFGYAVGFYGYEIIQNIGINIKDYGEFWHFVAATSWLGALVGSSIPAYRFSSKINERKKLQRDRLIKISETIDSKLEQ